MHKRKREMEPAEQNDMRKHVLDFVLALALVPVYLSEIKPPSPPPARSDAALLRWNFVLRGPALHHSMPARTACTRASDELMPPLLSITADEPIILDTGVRNLLFGRLLADLLLSKQLIS